VSRVRRSQDTVQIEIPATTIIEDSVTKSELMGIGTLESKSDLMNFN